MTEFFGSLSAAARQRRIGEIELALLDVGPAETVEERRVVGLDAAARAGSGVTASSSCVRMLGEHVAEIVQRVGVERIAAR